MGSFDAGASKGLLITDSVVGGIWAVDLATGAASLALQDDTMLSPAGATFAVGIDGFRIKGNYLYYTVFAGGILRRIQVEFPSAADLAAGTATLKQIAVDELANTGGSFDDLDVAADGTATSALWLLPVPRLPCCRRSHPTSCTSLHLVVLLHLSTALFLRLAKS